MKSPYRDSETERTQKTPKQSRAAIETAKHVTNKRIELNNDGQMKDFIEQTFSPQKNQKNSGKQIYTQY